MESVKKEYYTKRFCLKEDSTTYMYHLITTRRYYPNLRQTLMEEYSDLTANVHDSGSLSKSGTWPENVRTLHPMFK